MSRVLFVALTCAFALTACGGASQNAGPAFSPGSAVRIATSHLIQHVVVIVQENRSFDNLFATFPGAHGTRWGRVQGRGRVKLQKSNLAEQCDFGHSYQGFKRDYNGGKMNGFNLEGYGKCGVKAGLAPYQYVDPSQIAPYWDIATQYVLADNTFQTHGSDSFSSHQDLIRGATWIDQNQTQSLIDSPTALPWGCDAPPGTVTSLLVWTGSKIQGKHDGGPFPCSNKFPGSGSSYTTLRDLLDAKSLLWKYYSPPTANHGSGAFWNAFDLIAPVRYGPEWGTNVPLGPNYEKQIFYDISAGTLPAVSWVIPDENNSDHPHPGSDNGPAWVASLVNAIGLSPYWDSTAIVITWDDWGGFYDHVPPPLFDHWGGLGFRVPMMIVSPYARETSPSKTGYISHTQYEFGSILRFIEDTFALGSLGTTDARANSIVDSFDFTQAPRTFQQIPSSHSRDFFLHQRETFEPIDSQ